MKYMGSKSRIANEIVPIIQSYIDENNISEYIEPFVGGANVIDKIKCDSRIGIDKQKYLIELLKNVEKIKQFPKNISKEHYSEVRTDYNNSAKVFEDWYIGAIGFLASYNGRFFDGGYSGIVETKSGKVRNYYDEAKRNLETQIQNIKDIDFKCSDYKDIENLNSGNKKVIYCDPPYKNTKQYGSSKGFDHETFWNWVRLLSKNNIVLVSENVAPDDFEVIWEQNIKRTIDNTKRVDTVEKLFIMKK